MTLRSYQITARLIDPLTQRRSRQSQVSDSLSSIRGTTVRGALAQAYLQNVAEVDDRFRRLFLDETRVRFGPICPWRRSFPLTACSCKRQPGFPTDAGTGHGVVDQLWLKAAEQIRGGPLPLPQLARWMYCQHQGDGRTCGAALKPITGGWQPASDTVGPSSSGAPRSTVNSHVGIDRATSTAAAAILFTLRAIEPGDETWTGTIQATAEGWEEFREFLELIDRRIRIGHAKTRGYGRVELQTGAEEGDDDDPLQQQSAWQQWSDDLNRFLADVNDKRDDANATAGERDQFFSLSFPAGAILVDRYLRYTLDPSAMAAWLPSLPAPGQHGAWKACPATSGKEPSAGRIACVTAITKHELLRGWHSSHGLPRGDESAVVSGAVYVYQYRGASEHLWPLLTRLHRDGIGLRRNEGFGRVILNDAFHQQFSSPTGPSV